MSKSCLQDHKDDCKEIGKQRKKVSEYEIAMRGGKIQDWDRNDYKEFCGNQRINYFNALYLGNWWGYLDPRDYCRAVCHLSDLIKCVAWDYEVNHVWKECLDLKLSLLRYNIGDNQGLRDEVPFVLLYLNDDDKCVRFVKW
jgi:hypothetical protein